MTWQVRWSPDAARGLKGLPGDVAVRVARKVEESRRDPIRYFKRLQGGQGWRLRVGDYRVFADVRLTEQTIDVLGVRYRRNAYR